MLKEFRDFILKGNAIDLAVGVLIGAAFGKVVDAVTNGIINPLIKRVAGGEPNVPLTLWIFDFGLVINAIISLLIVGAILFFVFVKPMNKLKAIMDRKTDEPGAAPPELPADVKLLAEIRDLLKNRP